MQNPPSFAISVPIGAYHPLLRDCLESLAIQSPRPQVAILDASGDPRVAAVVSEFPGLASHHRAGPDGGQSDAIVEGWRHVDGNILGWLNADDALYPGALEEAARRFSEDPSVDLFYGHTVIINDGGALQGYHWAVEEPSEAILSGDIISQPSCFFRRSKLDALGGLNCDLHYTMDWDIWVRLWRAGANFAYTDKVLSRVLWSRDAKTGGFNRRRREELERIIGANASIVRRLKSRFGFALHHMLEYMAPAFLADFVRSAPHRRLRAINGIDRTGRISGEAYLPIVHYERKAMKGIEVSFSACGDIALSAAGASIKARGAGTYALEFENPVSSGEVVMLHFAAEGALARLDGVMWR